MDAVTRRRLRRARRGVARLRPLDERQELVKRNMAFSLDLVEKWSGFQDPGALRMAWKLWEGFRASFDSPEELDPPLAA